MPNGIYEDIYHKTELLDGYNLLDVVQSCIGLIFKPSRIVVGYFVASSKVISGC